MSIAPSPANAPPFVGPTPPDRVQMSLEDYAAGMLNALRTAPIDGQTAMTLRAFEEAKQQILETRAAELQPGAQQQPGGAPNAMSMSGGEQDYGTGFGDDIPGYDYGE